MVAVEAEAVWSRYNQREVGNDSELACTHDQILLQFVVGLFFLLVLTDQWMDHSGVDPCLHTRLLIDRIRRITLCPRRTAELQTLASAAYSLRATHGRGRELCARAAQSGDDPTIR